MGDQDKTTPQEWEDRNQDREQSRAEVREESPLRRRFHPVLRVIRAVRTLGNQPLVLRLKWLLAGMLIFVFAVVITQVQFNDVNEAGRVKIENDRLRDKYFGDRQDYIDAVTTYNTCISGVTQSLRNRGQHEAALEADKAAWNSYREQFILAAPSAEAAVNTAIDAVIANFVALQLEGPLLSQPARTYASCPPVLLLPPHPPVHMIETGYVETPLPKTVPVPTAEGAP